MYTYVRNSSNSSSSNVFSEIDRIESDEILKPFTYLCRPPTELPDVSGYPLLLAELTRDRRWSATDIKKLVGGNLLRVLKEVENHSATVSHQFPAEEWISQELVEDSAYCRYHDA